LVALLQRCAIEVGPVLDVAAGAGAVGRAVALEQAGYGYLGAAADLAAAADLQAAGFAADAIDPGDLDRLEDRLVRLAGDKPPMAVLLGDALTTAPSPAALLATLRGALVRLGRPPLVVAVPNAAHVERAVDLLTGRWASASELVGPAPATPFTALTLTELTAAHGWVEIADHDLRGPLGTAARYAADPALSPDTPLGQLLRQVRDERDAAAAVTHLVRAYALTDLSLPPGVPPEDPDGAPFLSVVVRTQGGTRMALLADALTCLAAQRDEDFEVLVAVHTAGAEPVAAVRDLVEGFEPSFARRVRVLHVIGGGRSRPLNEALAQARGRYLAFLDDDDVVTADWVERFHGGAASGGARIIRSGCVNQAVEVTSDGGWRSLAAPEAPYDTTFDFVRHLALNQTPICSVAIPRAVLSTLGVRFDESMPVIEDWDLLMRVARYTGVLDVGGHTSIYHQWQEGSGLGSRSVVAAQIWDATHWAALARYDRQPLLLPAGSVSRLLEAMGGVPTKEAALLEAELAETRARLEAIETSEWWRATEPLRNAGTRAKVAAGQGRRVLGPGGPRRLLAAARRRVQARLVQARPQPGGRRKQRPPS
jgi:hypothetical protein